MNIIFVQASHTVLRESDTLTMSPDNQIFRQAIKYFSNSVFSEANQSNLRTVQCYRGLPWPYWTGVWCHSLNLGPSDLPGACPQILSIPRVLTLFGSVKEFIFELLFLNPINEKLFRVCPFFSGAFYLV